MKTKPGRSLDVLIAENIFREKVYEVNLGNKKYPRMAFCYTKNPTFYDDCGETKYWEENFVPNYSADIKEAWKIVKHLNGPKMAFSLATCWDQMKTFKYIAKWEFWGKPHFEFAMDKSAPKAICLASLKALGIEVNE